jgi:predicted Rossmann fold nucleotide-binding protein DprA/Smf involved in DNA uptake
LIKTQRAQLVENAQDILNYLGWTSNKPKENTKQTKLALNLSDAEQKIYSLIADKEKISFDEMASCTKYARQRTLCRTPQSRIFWFD